jgi:hemerythrin
MSFPVPSPFEWDDTFDVGSDFFNTEHKKLFALINTLDANRSDAGALGALLGFVLEHFAHEEEKMTSNSYGAFDSHKAIHDQFVTDAKNLTKVEDGEIQFIKQWLVDHIKGSDMKYKGVL